MLGYTKSVIKGKSVKGRITFDKFLLEDNGEKGLVAAQSVACDCRDGRMKRGVGYTVQRSANGSPITIDLGGQEVIGGYDIALDQNTFLPVFIGADGILYIRNDDGTGNPKGYYVGENPVYHYARSGDSNIMHFFAGSRGVYYTRNGNSFMRVANEPLCGSCLAGKRLFILLPSGTVRYTAACHPEEWSGKSQEGGELYLSMEYGEPRGMAGFGDYAYVFMERGIYRITSKAKASEFVVEPIHYDGSRVIARSPLSMGAGVFFLTTNGLYRIQGERVEQICKNITVRPKEDCVATNGYCGDTVLMEYLDESSTRKRLVAHTDGKGGYFVEPYGHLCGSDFYCVDGTLRRFTQDTKAGRFENHPYFQTGLENFGHDGLKQLKRLILRGKGRVIFWIAWRDMIYSYDLRFVDGVVEAKLHEKSDLFYFRIRPMEGSELKSMTIEYTYVKD